MRATIVECDLTPTHDPREPAGPGRRVGRRPARERRRAARRAGDSRRSRQRRAGARIVARLGGDLPTDVAALAWRRAHSPAEAWSRLVAIGLAPEEAWDAV